MKRRIILHKATTSSTEDDEGDQPEQRVVTTKMTRQLKTSLATGQSRFKFTASVKFHGTLIASCSGQNKKESKKLSAKVALKKVAPNVYEDLYQDEEPPKDESIPGNEQVATPGKL